MTPVLLFELVLVLLAAALVISLVATRLNLPPAVALVIGGMALALAPHLPSVELDPDLIMVLFLPPLLMASASFTVWRDFRADLRPILMLAIGAVIFTTLVVGIVAHWVMPSLPWAACFALGAIVSPPDAVAAKAVVQRLHLPRRLVTILEGESLVNDASGLVLYRFAVAAALTGSFNGLEAGGTFVWLAVGGIAIGVACGFGMVLIAKRLDDGRMTIVASLLASYVAYLAAEKVHASGVLATVACGLVVGAREHEIFRAQVRIQAEAVWEIVVFVLEALVFVLIGLALRGVLERMGGDANALWTSFPLMVAVTVAVVVARFIWVFPGTYLPRMVSPTLRARDPSPPWSIPVVIGWAGMRGVVTLAAALALPTEFPGRDPILLTSFAVILFTVLIQGTTLGPLITRLQLKAPEGRIAEPLDMAGARVVVAQASLDALEVLVHPETAELQHPRLVEEYRRRVRALTRGRDERDAIEAERLSHFATALIAVQAGRDQLIRLHRERQIHVSVLRTIEGELDLEELRLRKLEGPGSE